MTAELDDVQADAIRAYREAGRALAVAREHLQALREVEQRASAVHREAEGRLSDARRQLTKSLLKGIPLSSGELEWLT